MKIHLASASPRRSEILKSMGVPFSAAGVDTDETPLIDETALELVQRLALAKATAALGQHAPPILGSDTVVTLDGQIFGKPRSKQHAIDMLSALSGRSHKVLTGVALILAEQTLAVVSETQVTFRPINDDELAQYWDSGEPDGKAGAYAIQGLGGVFVTSINGSYSGVMGLPVHETAELLRRAGIDVLSST